MVEKARRKDDKLFSLLEQWGGPKSKASENEGQGRDGREDLKGPATETSTKKVEVVQKVKARDSNAADATRYTM